jgi:hypothetical protein
MNGIVDRAAGNALDYCGFGCRVGPLFINVLLLPIRMFMSALHYYVRQRGTEKKPSIFGRKAFQGLSETGRSKMRQESVWVPLASEPEVNGLWATKTVARS